MRNQIERLARSVVVTGLVLISVAACQTVAEDWASVRPRPAPQVHQVQYAHAVTFAPGSDRLELAERDQLEAFLARLALGNRDDVFVSGGTAGNLDLRRQRTVAAYLAHRRVAVRAPAPHFGIGTADENAVSVVVRQYVVTLPGCPDWTDDPADTTDNLPSSNWGCATATNFGLMVAEPADLVQGRELGGMDGNTASLAIRRYRVGQTKPLNPDRVAGGGTSSEGGSE